MNKIELVTKMAEKSNLTKKEAALALDAFIESVEEALDNKEDKIPVNNLSTVIGTLYDKRALAKGESTANNKFEVDIKVVE